MTQLLKIAVNINGHDFHLNVEPRRTLADAIREDCHLTGTHIGCEHGACGACTVIVDGAAIRACLMFAFQADGKRVRTVESLTADGDELHPLQLAFAERHALQCGFCTAGFLMLILGMLESDDEMTEEEIIYSLSSNLCRCTGYQNIRDATRLYLDRRRTGISGIYSKPELS